MALLAAGSTVAYGKKAPEAQAASTRPGLEERIWLADDETLPELEREGVRLLQLSPGSAYHHFLLSHVYLRKFASDQQDVDALRTASELATQALELAPDEEYGYVAMAEVLDVLGQNLKAAAVVREGLKQSGGWRITFSKARINAERGNPEETLEALVEAIKAPGSLQRIIAPYLVIVARSRPASPFTTMRTLEDWAAEFPRAGFEEALANYHSERGNFEEAHKIYERILKSDPSNRELMFSNALIAYRKLGMTRHAIKQLMAVQDQLRSDVAAGHPVNKKLPGMVGAHLGAAYLRAGNLAKAHEAFFLAVDGAADRTTTIEFLFNEYKAKRAEKELVALLQDIAESGPGQGMVHAYMAEALSERLGKQDAAAAAYRRAIALEPTRSEYYNGLGLALYRQADMLAALTEFTRATEIDPGDAAARYNEACALALLGRKDEALYSLREAIQLEPRLSEQARVDKDFKSINTLTGFQELIASDLNDVMGQATASAVRADEDN
jgi:tetratricopeptide (TPR) repeat protein